MTEIWKPIPGFEGLYEVSDAGRVRSLHLWHGSAAAHVLGLYPSNRDYLTARLTKQGKQYSPNVHRLVALAFLGPCPTGHEVHHKDGNRQNNRADNLEYITRQENCIHSYRVMGKDNGTTKLTAEQVVEIRRLYAEGGITRSELGDRYGVTYGAVSHIIKRKTWKHV